MSAGMAGWKMVELRCVNARRYVSADGGIAVVATADGWQIINAATGKPMEHGVFYGSPDQAAGALTRRLREAEGAPRPPVRRRAGDGRVG